MPLRARAKRILYGADLLYQGAFPYYGCRVHFPKGSLIFKKACDEGIYERETVGLLTRLAMPGTTYIDVGANIGLLSIPVLAEQPDVRVISIEASPRTIKFLEKTCAESPYAGRWRVIGSAVGREPGTLTFFASDDENGAFDGFRDTGRGGPKQAVSVPVTTLDRVWREADEPKVSVVKIDVEGAETDVLVGASSLINRQRPAVVLEWSRLNLPAYKIEPSYLLGFAQSLQYRVFAHPSLAEVDHPQVLVAAMAQTETFLLVPARAGAP